jgi:hypothetical protein
MKTEPRESPEPWRWVKRWPSGEKPSAKDWQEGNVTLEDAGSDTVICEWATYADDSGMDIGETVATRLVNAVNACAPNGPVAALLEAIDNNDGIKAIETAAATVREALGLDTK